MRIQERRRGTAIVETSEGILIVSGSGERFLLPGGAADKGESRLEAAVRELREETGLRATAVLFLFRHLGSVYRNGHRLVRDDHKVYLIRADGQPRARQEISEVKSYQPGDQIYLSKSTRFIIDKFLALKQSSGTQKNVAKDSKCLFVSESQPDFTDWRK